MTSILRPTCKSRDHMISRIAGDCASHRFWRLGNKWTGGRACSAMTVTQIYAEGGGATSALLPSPTPAPKTVLGCGCWAAPRVSDVRHETRAGSPHSRAILEVRPASTRHPTPPQRAQPIYDRGMQRWRSSPRSICAQARPAPKGFDKKRCMAATTLVPPPVSTESLNTPERNNESCYGWQAGAPMCASTH